jgi:hypothetical protein
VVSFRQPAKKNAARELSFKRPGQPATVLLSTLGSVKQAAWTKDGGTFAVLLAGRKGGTELFLYDRQGQELGALEAFLEKRRLTKGGACMKPSKAWKALKMKGNELSLRADRCGKPRWMLTELKNTPKGIE